MKDFWTELTERHLYEHVPEQLSAESQKLHAEQKQRRGQQFLKGPIPLEWLKAAARLRGRASVVSQVIWFQAGLTGRREGLKITPKLAESFGLDRKACYRAIRSLETAGLIAVERRRGVCPRVTILKGSLDSTPFSNN